MSGANLVNENFFFDRAVPVSESGCWLWNGVVDSHGYAKARVLRDGIIKNLKIHRWAYEHFVGSIPQGMEVCHTCDVACCVNPKHLWLGTHAQNMADMNRKGRRRTGLNFSSRTHCKNGHPFDAENTSTVSGYVGRRCRACARERMRRYRAEERNGCPT